MAKVEQRNKIFQKSFEIEGFKQQRDKNVVELRKRKRFDHSNKRRANFISCEMSLQLDFSDEMIPLPLQLSYPNFLANAATSSVVILI